MIKEKEPKGTKTEIKIQTQLIRKINPHSLKNLPYYWQKMSDGLTKTFKHRIIVKVEDINTKDKLAFVIRKHYGYGKFNLLFYSRFLKNKYYNPKFKCRVQRGFECPYKARCRIYKIHKKGWSCKYNPKFRSNWTKRATIDIMPADLYGEKDYKYKWSRKNDRMFYFATWFWSE